MSFVYIHFDIYRHTHTHTHTHTYIHTHLYTNTHIPTYTYTHTHIHTLKDALQLSANKFNNVKKSLTLNLTSYYLNRSR